MITSDQFYIKMLIKWVYQPKHKVFYEYVSILKMGLIRYFNSIFGIKSIGEKPVSVNLQEHG